MSFRRRFFIALMIGRFYEAYEGREEKEILDLCQPVSSTPVSCEKLHDTQTGTARGERVEEKRKETVDKLSKLMSNASQDRLEFFSSALKVQTFSSPFFLVILC